MLMKVGDEEEEYGTLGDTLKDCGCERLYLLMVINCWWSASYD